MNESVIRTLLKYEARGLNYYHLPLAIQDDLVSYLQDFGSEILLDDAFWHNFFSSAELVNIVDGEESNEYEGGVFYCEYTNNKLIIN